MSIQKEKNGTYTLHYSKKDLLNNKIVRTKKRGFATLKEAKQFERNISREYADVSFYSLFIECQKSIEQEEDTLKNKISMIDNYLPILKTIQYDKLTKPFLLEIRNNIAQLDLAPKTKNKLIEILKTTSSFANDVYDFTDNAKILKRFKVIKKEFDIWSVDEYFKFEEALKNKYPQCVPFFRTLFFTGLRKGEARALTVDDLDVDNGYIVVNKSMRKYKSSLKAPKTPAGVRKVKLDINTLNLLKPLKQHEKWLFGDYKPISRDLVDRAFKYGIDESGVKKIRIHDLRHSHASYLIANGGNIVAISKRLGHSSINMTLSTYAHLIEDSENQLIEILNVANM